MREVLDLYWKLRIKAQENEVDLTRAFPIECNVNTPEFFTKSFNDITITLEILDFYFSTWAKLGLKKISTESEKTQRIILIQKMSFIEILSALEFDSKKIVHNNQAIFGSFSGRIYLGGIMKRSFNKGLIDGKKLNQWNGVIKLRNTLVHNNGISEESKIYKYPDISITLTKNKMTKGDLKMFGLLVKWILDNSRDWIFSIKNKN